MAGWPDDGSPLGENDGLAGVDAGAGWRSMNLGAISFEVCRDTKACFRAELAWDVVQIYRSVVLFALGLRDLSLQRELSDGDGRW